VRNTIVRLLTLTGSLASGYSFSLKEKGLIKGAFLTGGVPRIEEANLLGITEFLPLAPDRTIRFFTFPSSFPVQSRPAGSWPL
jgi:hypothetical protein